jgi:hypothetical protein
MLDELFLNHDHHVMMNKDLKLFDIFLELDKHEDLETLKKNKSLVFR